MKNSVILPAALLLAAASPLSAQDDRIALSGDRVVIYNLAGEIHLEPGNGSNVVVEVHRGGSDGDRLQVRRDENNGWQRLIIRYPGDRIVYEGMGRFSRTELRVDRDGKFGLNDLDPGDGAQRVTADRVRRGGQTVRISSFGGGLEAYADLRVLIPRNKAVSIHLGTGRVFVNNVDGDIQIDARSAPIEATDVAGFNRYDTGSGSITITRAKGILGMHTGSGGVKFSDCACDAVVVRTGSGSVEVSDVAAGELDIHTGSGGVELTATDAGATRVHTGSGGISARQFATTDFDLHTGSGSIRAELTRDIKAGRIETGSGSVHIEMPENLGAEMVVETGSGGISVGNTAINVLEARRSYLHGRLGDGNGILRISTGSGGVSFRSN